MASGEEARPSCAAVQCAVQYMEQSARAKEGERLMAGCGKAYNGAFKVTGAPLRCGQNLYWKTTAGKDTARELEVHLCPDCKPKEAE